LIVPLISRRCGWALVNAMIGSELQGFGIHQPDALPHRCKAKLQRLPGKETLSRVLWGQASREPERQPAIGF
jgi:hypothetical protein